MYFSLALIFTTAAASENAYNNKGLSFKYDSAWNVSEDHNELGDTSYTLITVDSPGSAFVSIAVYNRDMGLDKTVDEFRDGLKQNFEAFGSVTVEPYSAGFAGSEFKGYRLTVKALGIPHTNHVVGALFNERTMVISWQYADEDFEQFGPAIELIKTTLQVSK